MGTIELALPKIVEILGPEGDYEKRRLALKNEYAMVVAEAQKIVAIENASDVETATNLGRLLQVAGRETEAFYKEIKSQIDSIKKPVLDAEKQDSKPYEEQKRRLGELQTKYNQAEQKKQEALQRIAQAEAQRQADEEKLLRAIEHEELGDIDSAEAVLSETVYVPPVTVLSQVTKPAGSVAKVSYSAKLVNLMALVKAVAAGTVPLAAIEANQPFLNGQARLMKDAYSIPGTELIATATTHYRS